jgi:hypothetical protein
MQIETGPKSGKEPIHRFLVEIGAPVAPALLPKRIVSTGHDGSALETGRVSVRRPATVTVA